MTGYSFSCLRIAESFPFFYRNTKPRRRAWRRKTTTGSSDVGRMRGDGYRGRELFCFNPVRGKHRGELEEAKGSVSIGRSFDKHRQCR